MSSDILARMENTTKEDVEALDEKIRQLKEAKKESDKAYKVELDSLQRLRAAIQIKLTKTPVNMRNPKREPVSASRPVPMPEHPPAMRHPSLADSVPLPPRVSAPTPPPGSLERPGGKPTFTLASRISKFLVNRKHVRVAELAEEFGTNEHGVMQAIGKEPSLRVDDNGFVRRVKDL